MDLSVCTTPEHGAGVALRTVRKVLESRVKIDPLEKVDVNKTYDD